MGIESFNMSLLPYGVKYEKSGEYRILNGKSDIMVDIFQSKINDFPFKINLKRKEFLSYTVDDIFEILIQTNQENFIQGIEIRVCYACLDEGLNRIWDFIEYINKEVINSYIWFSFSDSIKIKNKSLFLDKCKEISQKRYEYFISIFGETNAPILSSDFYKWRRKQNSVLQKLKNKLKGGRNGRKNT